MFEFDITDDVTKDFSEHDWNIFSQWMKGVLVTDCPTIIFTKKDGTERTMRCTLREDLLPPREITEGTKTRKRSETSISVFDLDVNEWRSITIKNVKRVEVIPDYE